MATTLEELERRVTVLETRMRDNEKLDGILAAQDGILATQNRMLDTQNEMRGTQNRMLDTQNEMRGTQDMMMGMLRDHGRLLATHSEQLADLGGKMDMVVTWIQNQP